MPRVEINGVFLSCEIQGRGPAVALLPGFSAAGTSFDRIPALLADDFTVIAVDNRGAGRSDAPRGPYDIRAMAEETAAALRLLGHRRAVVVGHSMGGFIALTLALERPDLTAGAVLVSTAPFGRGDEVAGSARARAALAHTGGSAEEIVRGIVDAGIGGRLRCDAPSEVERFFALLLERPGRGRGVAGQRAAVEAFDMRDRLGDVGCPCAVVHGEEDELVPMAWAKMLAAGIPDARLVRLPGVGHFPQVEAPEDLAEEIRGLAHRAGAAQARAEATSFFP